MAAISFPRLRVCGTPSDRGFQYGDQAATRIRRSIAAYAEIFQYYANWDWGSVRDYAVRFKEPIESYGPHLLEELIGIARGAGVPLEDILAINIRTEVMNAAAARAAAGECTVVVSPPGIPEKQTIIGQNWDWKPATAETVVVLEAQPEGMPNFVTVVEAGLLAKTGMNAAGLGLVTNALVTSDDKGEVGVPYHAVLRGILEATALSGAIGAVTRRRRASSGNYLIAHRDGESVNLEAAPGDYSRVHIHFPDDEPFVHTNHFVAAPSEFKDVMLWKGPDSFVRLHRMKKLLPRNGNNTNIAGLQQALADHFNYPDAVCCHPNPNVPLPEQYATNASIIMDLNEAHMWIADGNPCVRPYVLQDYKEFFGDPD